jgi:hypothetical protein
MELQTLFKRESVADQSLRPKSLILSVQNNDGARSVPGCRDLELAGWKTGSIELVGLRMAK